MIDAVVCPPLLIVLYNQRSHDEINIQVVWITNGFHRCSGPEASPFSAHDSDRIAMMLRHWNWSISTDLRDENRYLSFDEHQELGCAPSACFGRSVGRPIFSLNVSTARGKNRTRISLEATMLLQGFNKLLTKRTVIPAYGGNLDRQATSRGVRRVFVHLPCLLSCRQKV
jgi:hypothetical protein